SPGKTKDLTIGLTPATANVTVSSAGSGSPVSGARVEIYLHTYTYQSGGWTESCTPVDTASTGGDGVAAFALPDNDPYAPPPVPQEGSRYFRYCVRVTSAGFLPFGPAHSAFWVTGGQQMTEYGPVDTYPVNLQPDFRRIRVQAQWSNGTPRNNVLIRVQGPGGYDVQKQTGAEGVPGEALFDNLSPGTYQVTRRQGNRWVDPRQVEAVSGEYLVTYIY
ncbi:MAG: hypothetical protein K6T65_16760, partial [Peptococcaceae bacterium]|nr:hypothetical protein [Peptococcaceae bacterium]